MRVDDRQQGLVVPPIDRQAHRFALPEFFTDALEDQDVGVHPHADREDNAGDTGEGQGRVQPGQRPDQADQVQGQREVGHQAGQAIIDHHKQDHRSPGDQRGADALFDGVPAQRGTDRQILDDLQRRGQGTGPEHDRKIVGLLHAERPGNLRPPPADSLLDHGGGINGVVQDDGHALLHVLSRDPVELVGPLGIERHGDVRIVELSDRDSSVAQDVASQHHTLFHQVGNAVLATGVFLHFFFEQDLVAFR